MKKAIVFGGSGFIGSYVTDELVKRGYNVTVADIKKSRYFNEKSTYIKCDILNPDSVNSTILNDVDIVYNFAGLADIDDARNHPS